jgi:hypothetical protein
MASYLVGKYTVDPSRVVAVSVTASSPNYFVDVFLDFTGAPYAHRVQGFGTDKSRADAYAATLNDLFFGVQELPAP